MRKACKMIATPAMTGHVSSYYPREVLVRGKDGSETEARKAIKSAHKLMKLKGDTRIQMYWGFDIDRKDDGTVEHFGQSISMTVGVYTIQGHYHPRIGYWVFKV